ncbi:MAG: hypothetical protein KGJ23_12430 [Euryarchaeota archaeon]|nr:hypothetical protein [Euryarchaeota archaeon]MDE1837404.1 hypothetical protein [Euryarchaeota archaeon]MDE1879913.1 hypothetical protein [Euryarchaeota archaeon]MDE2045496.1 hypothetical protein [Thermoplasmata archaeon]
MVPAAHARSPLAALTALSTLPVRRAVRTALWVLVVMVMLAPTSLARPVLPSAPTAPSVAPSGPLVGAASASPSGTSGLVAHSAHVGAAVVVPSVRDVLRDHPVACPLTPLPAPSSDLRTGVSSSVPSSLPLSLVPATMPCQAPTSASGGTDTSRLVPTTSIGASSGSTHFQGHPDTTSWAPGWQGITSASSGYVPPDVSMAVGRTQVVEAVNDVMQVWAKNGTVLATPFSFSTIFNVGNAAYGDPQVLYDTRGGGQFLLSVDDFTYGTVWLGISVTNDSLGGWYVYNLTAIPANDFLDRPVLGVSDTVIAYGGNVFTNVGGFVQAQWFAWDRAVLESGAAATGWYWYSAADSAVHPVPQWGANTTATQYYVCTTCGSGQILVYWVQWVPGVRGPWLNSTVYKWPALTAPPDAPQPGTSTTVSVALSGNQEMTGMWANGLLYFSFENSCSGPQGCPWYVSINTATNTVVQNYSYAGAPGNHVYYPATGTDLNGDQLMFHGWSSTSVYPTLEMLSRNRTYAANAYEGANEVYGTASDSYCGSGACRYGDYFTVAPDPDNPSVAWGAGEYIVSGLTWATWIGSVSQGVVPLAPPTASPAKLHADVGVPAKETLSDLNSQCNIRQIWWCTVQYDYGDGSAYNVTSCAGALAGLYPNILNETHTYWGIGNYTAGGASSYWDEYSGGVCVPANSQGGNALPEIPVAVNKDPFLTPWTQNATSIDVGQSVTFSSYAAGGWPTYTFAAYQSSPNFGCSGYVSGNMLGVTCAPTAAGTYHIWGSTTDSVGGLSPTLYAPAVVVYGRTSVSIGWSATTIDVGQTVTATATASGGTGTYTSYAWTPSSVNLGCAVSTTSTDGCTPTASGSYTIGAKVTDSNGGVSPLATSGTLTVDSAVTASTPAPNKWSVDVGGTVTFSTTPGGGSGTYSSYSWTPSSTNLGCATSTTASITCIPTAAGSFTVSVTVTDSNGGTATSTSASYTVFAVPTATTPSANLTSVDMGQGVTFSTTVSGGSGGTTISWSGLTTIGCASSNISLLACVPTIAATSTITATVTDSNGGTSTSASFSFTVYADPTASTPVATPSTVEAGQATSFATTASGGHGTYSYYWSGLPTGCSTSNVDPLPCTPSAAGTSSVAVTVIDGNGYPVLSSALSFTVSAGPSVTTPTATPAAVDVGQGTTLAVTASGGSGSYTYAWSGLPPGCSSSATSFMCTPTAAGTFHVGMNITDSVGGASKSGLLTLVVSPALTVPTPSVAPYLVDVGVAATLTSAVGGGAGGNTYTWSGLPSGCTGANAATTPCTPSAAGAASVTLKVVDANGWSVTSAAFSWNVLAAPTLSTPTGSPNPVTVGASLRISTTATVAAPWATYSWTSLPTGCTASNATSITCTPTAAGTFATKVSVVDGGHGSATSSAASLVVNPSGSGGLTVGLVASPATLYTGQTTTLTGTVSGGSAPYTYSWTGLPGGCSSANTATLSCTPTASGTVSVTLSVTDTAGHSGSASASLTVTASSGTLTVSLSASPTTVTIGQSSALTATVSAGTAPYTYTWTGLPSGCSSSNSATLSCAPAASGTFTIHVNVADSAGKSGSAQTTLTVNPGPTAGGSGANVFTNPYLIVGLIVAVVAVLLLVLLLRKKRPKPAAAPEPAPAVGAAAPSADVAASPPPPPAPSPPPPPASPPAEAPPPPPAPAMGEPPAPWPPPPMG